MKSAENTFMGEAGCWNKLFSVVCLVVCLYAIVSKLYQLRVSMNSNAIRFNRAVNTELIKHRELGWLSQLVRMLIIFSLRAKNNLANRNSNHIFSASILSFLQLSCNSAQNRAYLKFRSVIKYENPLLFI